MDKENSLNWFNSLETDALENLKLDFAVALERILEASGKNRKELAKEIDVSPARITNVLRGDANLTMEVMHKLAGALGHKVHFHIAPKDVQVRWFNVHTTQSQAVSVPAVQQQAGPTQVINDVPRYARAA